MAGKQVAADGLTTNFAGMSKNQLYDIMCQMKGLIEQNQQQARQILIQNPNLTKALFQAQIMLGMVQAQQAIPTIQPTGSPNLQPSVSQLTKSDGQSAPSLPGKIGMQDQTRKQQQNQSAPAPPSPSLPSSNLQAQSLPSHPSLSVQQPKGHIGGQSVPISLPQSSQVVNMPPVPHHSASQLPSHFQMQMPSASSQLEQPMHTSGSQHQHMQPQMPPQVRPSMQPFPRPMHPHMGSNVGFPPSGVPPPHHSHPAFHPTMKPPASMGPSFMSGQPPVPSQLPSQPPYQMGGSQLRTEFNQVGSFTQADRGSAWIPGRPENSPGIQFPGPPLIPGQMGASNQPPRPPALSPEMENALLQQVRSLTPEQINMLPPEQRNQVLQLQQVLRQ
ncbi:uncharacterized protein LOC107806009 [Nicotiana tabacum]|uniref:Cleavage stimulating factor 64-like n=1 Tax=Nicotiana tabacum TaxID=4097 RepID=A0A1S4B9U7_TOBAC|nr:cleavage stimulating factor 64 [Nicotiana tomentosiformis]XP_016485612.1 PREDICTED: cleavage stimulating factor 64-like [Nicotiana tabacum]